MASESEFDMASYELALWADSEDEDTNEAVIWQDSIVPDRDDPLRSFSDTEFRKHFRFIKEVVISLVDLLQSSLGSTCQKGSPLTVSQQVCCFLTYTATNSFQRMAGYLAGVSQATISRTIKRVSIALLENESDFMKMPTRSEMEQSAIALQRRFGIPRVALGVDGVFIRLDEKPKQKDLTSQAHVNPQSFFCRKQFYAITAQIIGDERQLIRHVDARWPGSTHDARVWSNNPARVLIESQSTYLVAGDSAFPISRTLIKPYTNRECEANGRRRQFNWKLSALRAVCTENIYGALKRRFPILRTGMRTSLSTSLKIIKALCILHNIAILSNEGDDFEHVEELDGGESEDLVGLDDPDEALQDGFGVRDLGKLRREEILNASQL